MQTGQLRCPSFPWSREAHRSLTPPFDLSLSLPGDPTTELMALEDGFAQHHLRVTVLRHGEEDGRLPSTHDMFVNGAVMHLVAVRESFRVSAGVIGKPGDVDIESR